MKVSNTEADGNALLLGATMALSPPPARGRQEALLAVGRISFPTVDLP
jgi:hypothetical protein